MQSGRFIFFLRQQNDCGFAIEETDTGLFQQRGVVRHVVGIRRTALREAYLKKFRVANQGNHAYAEDPDKFITGNFRPVHDYIRQIQNFERIYTQTQKLMKSIDEQMVLADELMNEGRSKESADSSPAGQPSEANA